MWCRSIPSICAGSRVYLLAFWVSCQRAGDFAATVLPLQGWRLRRPPPRSAYAYTPSGARPAESAHALKQSVPLAAAKSPAHVTFWPWGGESRPHPSLRAGPCALPRHPRPIRVAWLRRGIPRHRHARASARLPRTGRPPPPCARSSASPPHPDPRSGGASLSAALARSRLAAEALGSPASRGAAEGGGWRTRGRSGSSAASAVPLAETLSAEGSGSSRLVDLRAAAATTPRSDISPTRSVSAKRMP